MGKVTSIDGVVITVEISRLWCWPSNIPIKACESIHT